MGEENRSQEFRLKNIDETKNYFIKAIDQNEFMRKKHKKLCTILNYTENFLILAFVITGCFCFCFLSWYSYRNHEFCNRIKHLCNNRSN